MIAALLLAAATPVAAKVDAVARATGLAGEVLVGKGERIMLDRAYGKVDPAGGVKHKPGARWRLASISKQITAALLLRDFAADLDKPLAPKLNQPALGSATLRQLLTHHSGLANPDDAPAGPDGLGAFYKAAAPDTATACPGPPPPTNASRTTIAIISWPPCCWPRTTPGRRA